MMETSFSSSPHHQLTKEVLVAANTAGQFWNVGIWDHQSGTNLQQIKNCSTGPHGLAFLRDNYMLCAIQHKPYIMFYNLKGGGKMQPNKISINGFVNCLTTSACGNFVFFGIEEKVFVLQAHSGKILVVLSRHLQNVTCLRVTPNNKYLITGSDDTTINVWDLHELLNREVEFLKPTSTWNSHSMKINDLFVSETSDRVVSASADQTCKFWNLYSDKPFPTETILFDAIPTTCMLDHMELTFFAGLANGTIFSMPIKSVTLESNKLAKDELGNRSFVGHKQKVTCLSISCDDTTLASGSEDATVRVWDTYSKQCIKIIQQNGAVTNLSFQSRARFFNDEKNIVPDLFSRYANDSGETDTSMLAKKCQISLTIQDFLGSNPREDNNCHEEYYELKAKYESMKQMNDQMYNFAVEKILSSSS